MDTRKVVEGAEAILSWWNALPSGASLPNHGEALAALRTIRGGLNAAPARKIDVAMVAEARPEEHLSLPAAMGLLRCVHGGEFPCGQCQANRGWNEQATGHRLTEGEFERRYAMPFSAQEEPA